MTQAGLGFDLFSPIQATAAPTETRLETFVPYILAAGALAVLGLAFWGPSLKPRKRRR